MLMKKMTRFTPLVALTVILGSSVSAEPLSQKDLIERLSIFGADFLVEVIEGPLIRDPWRWVSPRAGDFTYRFVEGSDDGSLIQTEHRVADTDTTHGAWERHIGERTVETFFGSEATDVVIVQEIDRKHNFRIDIQPGVHLPANIQPGDEWQVSADLSVYQLDSDELYKEGRLKATHTYEGAFRVRTPAGVFDTILVREDFQMHIGPLKAEDDRFLFFAKDIGLVAEIEAIRASAIFVVRVKENSAKVLEVYPASDQT
jgi:hypothetical protein